MITELEKCNERDLANKKVLSDQHTMKLCYNPGNKCTRHSLKAYFIKDGCVYIAMALSLYCTADLY